MFENVGLRAVESELVELAGHLAAATCRFLQLLAEFDDRDGWAGPGLRSCAHWLNWRVGLSLRTAREQLRVAHALRDLPEITAVFAAGRVSYAKVRALTRIATPASERGLLSIALHGTASHVESVVAAARAGGDPRPAAARRGMRWSRAGDGSLLVSLRIPAAEGAQLVAAVEALLAEDAGGDAAGAADGNAAGDVNGGCADVDGDADVDGCADVDAEAGIGSNVGGIGDGSAEPRPDAAAASLARGSRPAREERPGGRDGSAEPHPPGQVADPLAARRLDALLDLVTGARQAEQATLVVHLRTDPDPDADPDLDPGADPDPDPDHDLDPGADPGIDAGGADTAEDIIADHGTPDAAGSDPAASGTQTAREIENRRSTEAMPRPAAWIEGGPVLHPAVAERLTCTAGVQALLADRRGNPLYLGRRRRTVSPAQVRALRVRDRDRCVFPGCTSTRHLQAHHLRWWRHGGRTDLGNLALVCGFHHTLVHEQAYRLVAEPGGGFTAACPDGTPIPRAGAPTSGDPDALRVAGIDDHTITPRWGGERLDRDQLLAWLLPTLRATHPAAA